MTRSRRFLQVAGMAALGAMLFAQAAFALAACESARQHSRAMMAMLTQVEPCHAPAGNASLCFAHCQSEAQTLDKHQVKVPALSAGPALAVRAWPEASASPDWAPRAPLPVAGPPPRILFRSLLI